MITESIIKPEPPLIPQPTGCLGRELLAMFVSHEIEKVASGVYPVTYHSLYEIWTYSDGKDNTHTNLLEKVTRNGAHCGGGLFAGAAARRRLAEIRARVRREVELSRVADDIFLVRFLDPQRSKDDLPEIRFRGDTWAPYHGKRVTNTDAPGYYVQYGIWNSEMASLLARIGNPSGQMIGLEAALISYHEISDESIQALITEEASWAEECSGLYANPPQRFDERDISPALTAASKLNQTPIQTFQTVG